MKKRAELPEDWTDEDTEAIRPKVEKYVYKLKRRRVKEKERSKRLVQFKGRRIVVRSVKDAAH